MPEKDKPEWVLKLDPKLLWIKDNDGKTVAHWLAGHGTLPEKWITEELFRTKDYCGFTVAHEYARSGKIIPKQFVTEELLREKSVDGTTVAHILAWNGKLPEEYVNEELLQMASNEKKTVAHNLAYSGTLPEKFITEESLRMKTRNGSWCRLLFPFLSKNTVGISAPVCCDAYKRQIL